MRIYLFAAILLFSACSDFRIRERGNGKMIEETYNVREFDKLQISGAYEISIENAETERVEVRIDENLQKYLNVEVKGNTLVIENTERIASRRGIEVVVYYREIQKISVSGACDLESEDIIKGDRLVLDMSGAGAVDLNLDVQEFDLRLSGAGSVRLAGKADRQTIELSGAGGYGGFGLITKSCKIDISGIGSADVFVEDRLDATISGLGGIAYKGSPSDVNSNVSGLGNIRNAD